MRTLVGLTNSRDVKAFARYLTKVKNKDDYRYVCLNNRVKATISDILGVDETCVLTEVDMFDPSFQDADLSTQLNKDEIDLLRTCSRYDAYSYFPFTYAVRSYLYNKTPKDKVLKSLGYLENKLKAWEISQFVVSSTDKGLLIYTYLYFISKGRGIPSRFITFTRVFKLFVLTDNPLEQIEKELLNERELAEPELLTKHKSNLIKDISTHKLFYGDLGSRDTKFYRKDFLKKTFQPWRWKRILKQVFSNNFGNSFVFDRSDNLTELFLAFRRWKNSKFYKNVGIEVENLPEKFVYYPLHQEPEVSTLVLGNKHVNQLKTLKKLAKKFKKLGLPIIVKDHPAAFQMNTPNRLKAISKIDNVCFAALSTNSLDLIKKAEITVAITGTSAFEAKLLGKKSVVLNQCVFHNSGFKIVPLLNLEDEANASELWSENNDKDLIAFYNYVTSHGFHPADDCGLLTDETIDKLIYRGENDSRN